MLRDFPMLSCLLAAENGNSFLRQYGMGLFFIIPCGGALLLHVFWFIRKLVRCKVKVNAEVVRVLPHPQHRKNTSAPEYRFFYEGEEYTVHSKLYNKREVK